MEIKNKDAGVTLGISIPVDPSKQNDLLSKVPSDASLDYNHLRGISFDRQNFSRLSGTLDPNLGIMGHLPSSNIAHEKSTFNLWNIEPYFLHILPISSSCLSESSVLIFGGLNPSSVIKKKNPDFDIDDFVLGSSIFQYLLNSGIWKYYGTMIEPRCYHACALDGQYVYITGGYSLLKREFGEMLAISSTERLNLNDRQWKSCANMISSRAAHALVSHKGRLYAFGGRNSQGNILSSAEMYYPDQDVWIEITSIPQPTMGLSATCVKDAVWLIGGISDASSLDSSKCLLSSVFSFIPSTNRWYIEEPLPYACAYSSCVSSDYAIWLVGGCTASENSKEDAMISCSTVLQLSLSEKTSKWKSITSLLFPRHAITSVLYDEHIYIFGGIESDKKCASDKVEVVNFVGNRSVLSNKTPVSITGCASVLILKGAENYQYTKKANDDIYPLSERKRDLYGIEEDYSSESFRTSSPVEKIVAEDRTKHMPLVSDRSHAESESTKKTEKKDFVAHENIKEREMKQNSFDEKEILSHYSETKERKAENSQNVRYRASMEIFVNPDEISSSEISSSALKRNKTSALKWLNYLQKLSASDEKFHEIMFQSKEPKLNIQTEVGYTESQESCKRAEVKYFEEDPNLATGYEDLDDTASAFMQNYLTSNNQSFMYVQSNIKPRSIDGESEVQDNLPLVPPDTLKITINEDSFPIVLLMGGEYSRNTIKSRFILSYYCNENIWKCAGFMPEYRCHHCAVFLNNKIYIIGGFDSDNSKLNESITNKTFYYDIHEETWHDAAGMNYARAHHSAVVLKDDIYVIGGRDQLGKILSSVEVYSESTHHWKKCKSLFYPVLGAATFTSNSMLYIFGGITYKDDNEIISSGTAVFDPKDESWSKGPDMLTSLAFCGISGFSNSAWLFGGLKEEEGNLVSSKHIFKFDLLSETWSKVAELSVSRLASVTISIENKVYVIGGHSTQDKKEVLTCELIDLLKNEISIQESLPIAISGRAGIVITEISNTKTS